MKIEFIEIYNFRKLQSCKVELSTKQTVFVGANNSGKTSAIDALICFLDNKKMLTTTDFTLSHWKQLNEFADSWLNALLKDAMGLEVQEWMPFCPSIDIWIDASVAEIHLIDHLIPTLKWNGEALGVRRVFQPKDINKLREDYTKERKAVLEVQEQSSGAQLSLWPRDFKDYLNKKLLTYFEIKTYLLDPNKKDSSQTLDNDAVPFDFDPLLGVFKVDIIEASRGFTDPSNGSGKSISSLSTQLNDYYNRHLNPTELPEVEDLDVLEAIQTAQTQFDQKLEKVFKGTLDEIKQLGYPGFNDPDIKLSSRINPIKSLEHEAAVIFDIHKQDFGDNTFSLPEQYNGLGYKNLIHIIFKLISFRDKWQRQGKAGKKIADGDLIIEPIHLVIIEEPEAHLHAQVQQVFIREAYKVLRKNIYDNLTTQLVISTHSSYIAYEAGFENLRYFKRKRAKSKNEVPSAVVVNLSTVFSSNTKKESDSDHTKKFVSRYLKTVHCDLFFANGIILVEGAAERMLLPHFIENHYKSLRQSYISILEIGGAHAQRLKPLINILEIPTLIITDTDACDNQGKKVMPIRNKGYRFGSDTLKSWFELGAKNLDEILDLKDENKIKDHVRAAYQYGINIYWNENDAGSVSEAIPYTFEDAIALTNLQLFRGLNDSVGMVKLMHLATQEDTMILGCTKMYEALKGEKAKMALDLLYDVDPAALAVPKYIDDGLVWLETQLNIGSQDFSQFKNAGDTEIGEMNE